jgi:Family of unknown function (DUF6510)
MMMRDEYHVDGNAIGGLLLDVFGREMTDAEGCCASCGAVHQIAEMQVYRGMGDVVRCPTCGNIVIVAVTIRERTRLHLDTLRWLEPAHP